ncbi:MAG: RNA-binding protein, partial [Myxococcota bacterium]|nr:RNA-binding protein [Myxococcota bacterium]
MGKKLFCGGLAWATNDDSLRAACAEFGTVVEAKVILDRE